MVAAIEATQPSTMWNYGNVAAEGEGEEEADAVSFGNQCP